ncbi:MAG TPA: class I SAM-dependent methyltransferase [Terriglobales bacterium]|jgi:SAM-dependent methyltransferase|nr:class I SAM-dependent methyltransferase [Terriglobales bacterium]
MRDPPSREELLKIAHQRLYPSLANPNYLVLRSRRRILAQWMDQLPARRLDVLDLGGRYQPYRPLLGDRAGRYVALDILGSALVDVVGTGQQLPFRSSTFDLVIATSVFEYFPEPRIPAEEVLRVLKPGGHFIISVASMFPKVVDAEHWRFLPAGLRFVLRPFAEARIVPEVGSVGGFLRFTAASLSIFAKYNFMRQLVHHTLVPMMNILGLALDRPSISVNDQLSGNYSALAQKGT